MRTKLISSVVYEKFIEYAVSRSDYFSLTKYNDSRYIRTKQVIDYILNDKKITIKEIINNDTSEMTYKLCKLYKEDITIFKIEILQKLHISQIELEDFKTNHYSNNYNNIIEDEEKDIKKMNNTLSLIESGNYKGKIDNSNLFSWVIDSFKYENNINKFLKKNENLIYSNKKICGLWSKKDKDLFSIVYKFKIFDETKKILFNNFENIYSWSFPNNLEDLCFYKNDICWFYSVSHEKICDIYCENEEEYNYLKSIGIEFYIDHYVKEEPLLYDEV